MQVLVNSDHHIVGDGDLTERVQGVVEGRLDRFEGRITRVEVHLSDLTGSKLGERDARLTLRCLMEARIGGLKPMAVSHEAPTLTEAIHVAADKLERAIEDMLGRLEDGGPAATEGQWHGQDAGQLASVEAVRELERTSAPSAATHSSPGPESS